MSIPTVNIKTLLVNAPTLSLVAGTNLWIGREPDKPNNTVTLFDTPDRGPMLFNKKKEDGEPGEADAGQYLYAGVQARIRNTDYDKAMNLANDIVKVLHNTGNKVVGGTLVTLIEAIDNPFLLDYDDNNRARVVVNFAVQQTPQPST